MDTKRDLQQRAVSYSPGTGQGDLKALNGTQAVPIEALTPREAEVLKLIARAYPQSASRGS